MMKPTPEQEKIIQEERIALMATIRRDGSAQLAPINYVYADGQFLISTTKDRARYHNILRNPSVTLCIVQAGGRPYVTVSGRADIEETNIADGTAQIFRSMSDRPLPENFAETLAEQRRVLITVTPERFIP